MRTVHVRIAACLALTTVLALAGTTVALAAEDAAAAAAAKISKQVASILDALTALQTEESQTTIKILQAKKTAMDTGKIEDIGKTRDEMAKGNAKGEWRDYKQVLTGAGQQWELTAQKYARLAAQLKAMERDREKATPDAQAQMDVISKRLADKHRAVLERAADCYYDAAEYKKALPIYAGLYQEIPEDKRTAEKSLTDKLADIFFVTGDYKTSFKLYEGLYKAATPAEQKTWATQRPRERMANIYEKNGDFKSALPLYKSMLETYEPNRRTADETKWLRDKIAGIEAKLGTSSSAPAAAKGGANTGGKR